MTEWMTRMPETWFLVLMLAIVVAAGVGWWWNKDKPPGKGM